MRDPLTYRYPRTPITVNPGDRYGEFVVLQEQPRKRKPSGMAYRVLQVRCSCGVIKDVSLQSLRAGTTVSCGHVQRETARLLAASKKTHGLAGSAMHIIWSAMIQRCHNKKNKSYARYGAKGISVCDEWRTNFAAFAEYIGDRPAGMTIDRINSRGNYEPGNVRWASPKEQARNTSRNRLVEVNGIIKCMSEWCEITGVTLSAAKHALDKGRNPFDGYSHKAVKGDFS